MRTAREALTDAVTALSQSNLEATAHTIDALILLLDALPSNELRLAAMRELADDLLEAHEETGISLDAWVSAREFVEAYHGPITENGA